MHSTFPSRKIYINKDGRCEGGLETSEFFVELNLPILSLFYRHFLRARRWDRDTCLACCFAGSISARSPLTSGTPPPSAFSRDSIARFLPFSSPFSPNQPALILFSRPYRGKTRGRERCKSYSRPHRSSVLFLRRDRAINALTAAPASNRSNWTLSNCWKG